MNYPRRVRNLSAKARVLTSALPNFDSAIANMTGVERYIGEILDGKYRLERLLGKGGMGAVFLATHLGTERYVALKLIAPQFMSRDEFVERFKREARAAGRLRHPNVVDVTDFGFAQLGGERAAYLVMEYLDGCALADVLEEEKKLPLDWVVDIMEQVCSAVDEAHRQGIVHRDLKPDNIWLEPTRLGGYRVKVLDFGIAKLGAAGAFSVVAQDDAPKTRTSEIAPPRMAGEMARAETKAHASAHNLHHDASASAQREAATQLLAAQTEAGNSKDEEDTGALLLNGDAPPKLASEQAASVAVSSDEDGTRILDSDASSFSVRSASSDNFSDDDGTRILEDDGTRILDAQSQPVREEPFAQQSAALLQTAPANGVTRVGAILGTPLYMSPEQCRGERLDARSDVYSLGVIAYQMLTGATPFAGDTLSVIKQHKDSPPPALRSKNKKIPKKVSRVIESALRKDPDGRPPDANAFASELRASSEGLGALLRRSFALYSEHFTAFLRISLLAHLPIIALIALEFGNGFLESKGVFSSVIFNLGELQLTGNKIIGVALSFTLFFINFLTASVITGMTVLLVIQLTLAPMRPVNLRELFAVFRKRFRALFVTGLMVALLAFAGLFFLIIPFFVILIRNALYAPVVLVEGLQKRAAMRRAVQLMKRSRWSVVAVSLIQMSIPIIVQTIFLRVTGGLATHSSEKGFHLTANSRTISRLSELLKIFIVPLISILTALLYLKMRQLGGETLKNITESFESSDSPRTRWQMRMRERLTFHSNPSR